MEENNRRLQSRREFTPIPYSMLYSSDRRKDHKKLPESATFTDARASIVNHSTMSQAVGLDTRELWMMSSLRSPGINGLI